METILICAVVVLAIGVVINEWRLVESRKEIEKLKTDRSELKNAVQRLQMWSKRIDGELGTGFYFSCDTHTGKILSCFKQDMPSKLNLLLDHLKLEIINEPSKTVVRRKK